MTNATLFDHYQLGELNLPNRMVMAPLTRNRALPDGDLPHALHEEYYAQRASAGLIITEASQISPEGKGYIQTPGIYSQAQVAAWKRVTDAVHAKGGHIFLQLWHVGRISHTSLQPDGKAPVAPSEIAAEAMVFTAEGFTPTSKPRALETSEIPRLVADFGKAAANAKRAGFDGVEIHAANGYLIDQFLSDGANKRTDAYGGSVENRTRLLAEVIAAAKETWAPGRIGIRFSPLSGFNDIQNSDPAPVFTHAVELVNKAGLGYIHLVEGEAGGPTQDVNRAFLEDLKSRFDRTYIGNNGYDGASAQEAVGAGKADLIAFGRLFIANPDLPARLAKATPLNALDGDTLYGGDHKGYTDYPALDVAAAE